MSYPHLIIAQIHENQKQFLKNYILDNKVDIFSIVNNIGALLFRDFNIKSADDFYDIVSLLHLDLSSYVGGDSPRTKVKKNIYTSTEYPPDQFITMHHEKSYSSNYPKFVYFFCEVAPQIGGETPILDSRLLYKSLDPKIIDKFRKKKLKYVMNLHSSKGLGRSWKQVFEVETKRELEQKLRGLQINYRWKTEDMLEIWEIVCPILTHPVTRDKVFFSQAHQWHKSALEQEIFNMLSEIMPPEDFYHNCYYGDGSEIELEYIEEINKKIETCKITFQWKRGDLLMVDNIISMHGRNPFKGPRRILVAMS